MPYFSASCSSMYFSIFFFYIYHLSCTNMCNNHLTFHFFGFSHYVRWRPMYFVFIEFGILLTSVLSYALMSILSSVQFSQPVMSSFFDTKTAAHQASLSITNSQSLLKLMSVESVMPSNHLILCRPLSLCLQSFPPSGSFPMSQFFTSSGQSIGVSASGSVLPMNIQDWFPLQLTDLISLKSKGLSRVFSNTTIQKHQFFNTQLSLYSNSHIHTWLLEKP